MTQQLKKLIFVTGNANKLAEVQTILGGSKSLEITSHKLDLPELQGTIESVAIEKCRQAANLLKTPVITEDTALCFDALNGLPGVYIKWFLEGLGNEGLNKMLQGFNTTKASAVCTFAYSAGPGAEPILFQGITKGDIVMPRGPTSFGWDPIFQPEGHTQSYAEMPKSLKNTLSHRSRALDKLKQHFLDENSN